MNKADLVAAVSETMDVRKSDVSAVLEVTIDVILNSLMGGERVNISGLGAFYVVERNARVARNPKTGEEVQVAAKKVAKFKAAKALKELFS